MFEVFSKRNRKEPKADVLIYDELPQQLKVQIVHIWQNTVPKFAAFWLHGTDNFYGMAANRIYKEFGVFRLTNNARNATEDVCNYFLQERDVEKCLTVIELIFDCFVQIVRADSYVNAGMMTEIRQAADELNARLKEHAVGYEFKDGKIIRIDSGFIHAETVIPAMTLLQDAEFSGANQEFMKGHEHFRHGRFPEAMNECLKAFESTMKAICHKRGWQYNQTDTAKTLLATCEKNGLFPAYMQSSLAGLRSVLENVATVRNKLSGHGQGVQQVKITEETAAFVIHYTAANILYLASLEKLR
jgi:hypothetical protein